MGFLSKLFKTEKKALKGLEEKEETLNGADIQVDKLQPIDGYNLDQLKRMLPKDNADTFFSQELKVGTRFGEYKVSGDIFNAKSYNEFLQKIMNTITINMAKVTTNGRTRSLPTMQIDNVKLVAALDTYIRTKLFDQDFDPFAEIPYGTWQGLCFCRPSAAHCH